MDNRAANPRHTDLDNSATVGMEQTGIHPVHNMDNIRSWGTAHSDVAPVPGWDLCLLRFVSSFQKLQVSEDTVQDFFDYLAFLDG
jgi:hypothetical protein